jgi:hypothetical protein
MRYGLCVRPEVVDRPYQAKDDRADSADRPASAKGKVYDHVVVARPAFYRYAHIYERPKEPEDCDAKRYDEVGLHREEACRPQEATRSAG